MSSNGFSGKKRRQEKEPGGGKHGFTEKKLKTVGNSIEDTECGIPAPDTTPAISEEELRQMEELPPTNTQSVSVLPGPRIVRRNPHIIYPDQYDQFDASKIVFANKLQKAREGGGEILFMNYQYSDGRVLPLLIQTPKVFLQTGVTVWSTGSPTMLCSLGKEWEQNERSRKFSEMFMRIEECIARHVHQQEYAKGYSVDQICEMVNPTIFTGVDAEGIEFPPAFKTRVTIDGNARTEFFNEENMMPMAHTDVTSHAEARIVVHVKWVFRKKSNRSWQFMVNLTAFQVVVNCDPSGLPYGEGCTIVPDV